MFQTNTDWIKVQIQRTIKGHTEGLGQGLGHGLGQGLGREIGQGGTVQG